MVLVYSSKPKPKEKKMARVKIHTPSGQTFEKSFFQPNTPLRNVVIGLNLTPSDYGNDMSAPLTDGQEVTLIPAAAAPASAPATAGVLVERLGVGSTTVQAATLGEALDRSGFDRSNCTVYLDGEPCSDMSQSVGAGSRINVAPQIKGGGLSK